jgi:protein-tyrosine phosphatase
MPINWLNNKNHSWYDSSQEWNVIVNALAMKKRVLVHCINGKNRTWRLCTS